MAGNPDILDGLAELAEGLPNIYKILMTPLKEGAEWLDADVVPFIKGMIEQPVGKAPENYAALHALSKSFAASLGLPADVVSYLLTIFPIYLKVIMERESYATHKATEYGVRAEHLIEIPGPGEIIRSMINTGGTLLYRGAATEWAKALQLHGFTVARAKDLENATRHALDYASVWKLSRRIKKPTGFDVIEYTRRAGVLPDQESSFRRALESLMTPDLLARLGWRTEIGAEDLKARMVETGVAREYAGEWLKMLESVLPPDLAVRGLWREAWNRDGALERLRAGGLRKEDREPYLDLATSLLPIDLIARGLWRGRDDASTALDRMTALGVDRKDAGEWLVRMQSVMGPGDLARLLYAGQISVDGYVDGLERFGVGTEDATALANWPWQAIPASETLRLYLAGRLGDDDARKAMRTTGIPPEVADAILSWPYKATGLGETKLLFNRGIIHSGDAAERLKAGGMRPDDAKAVSLNLNDPLPVDALFQMHRRGMIDREAVVAGLIKHGYTGPDAERFADLCWIVPTPSDVITFAIRDVFEPDVVEHFGYDEEFPEAFVEWARKAGITREVAQLHWWSHWYVPGVGEVFNMFHRVKPGQRGLPREERVTWVTDKDVDVYLKTQDYPPWWREPLKAISYHPISRVDIRRAYEAGLADEDDVYETNRALGYSHRDSEILTEWTKWAYMAEDDALLVAKVRDGLIDGSLTPEDARSILAVVELPDYRVDLIIDWSAYEQERKKKDLSRSTVQRLYVERYIDEDEVRVRLAALQYGGTEIELLLALWVIDRGYGDTVGAAATTRPTRTNLAKFWKDGVIGEREWDDEMTGLGYDPRYAAWYKEDDLIAWTVDKISDYYVRDLMHESTMVRVLTGRGWTLEGIEALKEYKRGRE